MRMTIWRKTPRPGSRLSFAIVPRAELALRCAWEGRHPADGPQAIGGESPSPIALRIARATAVRRKVAPGKASAAAPAMRYGASYRMRRTALLIGLAGVGLASAPPSPATAAFPGRNGV